MIKLQPANIKPLSDRVLVQRMDEEQRSAGGIVIPDTATKDKSTRGEVLAVGPGKQVDGQIVPLTVSVGDKILFGQYSGTDIKVNTGEEGKFVVMREEDVIAIIEE